MTFEGFVTWVVVGILTGSLAGVLAKGGGRGLIGDVSLGLGGSLMGRSVFHVLGGSREAGWLVMAAVMFVAAAGVIALQRRAWPPRA